MSYITVSAEKVINCCEAFLINNDMIYRRIQANEIKKLANEKKSIFFGSKYTYDEAYNILEKDISFTKRSLCYHMRPDYERFNDANNLLKLAKHGDPVIISDEHAFILNWGD